jgi:pimeloyl-ACP methyl ester carboxylesterase
MQPQQRILIDPLVALDATWGAQVVERFSEGIGQAMHQTTPWLSARNKLWHRCDVQWKAEALQQCRRDAVEGLFLHSGSWQLVDELAAVQTPTLCLVASADTTVISPAHQAMLSAMLPLHGGQYRQIDGTDHNMHRAGFDLTMPVLHSWITQERV